MNRVRRSIPPRFVFDLFQSALPGGGAAFLWIADGAGKYYDLRFRKKQIINARVSMPMIA